MTRHVGSELLGLVVALTLAAPASRVQDVDPQAVRARLHAYLTIYERELSTLVADEHMTQWPHARAGTGRADSTGIRRDLTRAQRTHSEVAFVPLPGGAGWLGYRDVRKVNDRPVRRSGPPLEELLRLGSTDARERAIALLLEGAKHNLGAPRTINLPNLPLELLHSRNQERFTITGTYRDRTGDCDALRLDFEEMTRPTVIQRPEGGDMPSRIAAWVEPATGRLCRAEVRTKDAQLGAWFEALVRVDFGHDPVVGLTVPVRLYEVFFDPPRSKADGEATYSNYRRFATSARIVPPLGRH